MPYLMIKVLMKDMVSFEQLGPCHVDWQIKVSLHCALDICQYSLQCPMILQEDHDASKFNEISLFGNIFFQICAQM